jgi:hypothetical protein
MTLDVRPITSRLAREVAEREHYMHRKPNVLFAFGLFEGDTLRGICVFGTPPSRHLQVGVSPDDPGLVIELNRLWVSDRCPTNTESWFVSRCLRALPPRIVVSYADTTQGHMGYVYRALNFRYAGWTDMERRTPRYDYVPTEPGVHSRDAFRNGYKERVRRQPKVKYWTVTGDKRDRARLRTVCQWPSVSWKDLPPPVEHVNHKL